MNITKYAANFGKGVVNYPILYGLGIYFAGMGIYDSVHGDIKTALLSFGFAAAFNGLVYALNRRR